jgi:hypothetical protein
MQNRYIDSTDAYEAGSNVYVRTHLYENEAQGPFEVYLESLSVAGFICPPPIELTPSPRSWTLLYNALAS